MGTGKHQSRIKKKMVVNPARSNLIGAVSRVRNTLAMSALIVWGQLDDLYIYIDLKIFHCLMLLYQHITWNPQIGGLSMDVSPFP